MKKINAGKWVFWISFGLIVSIFLGSCSQESGPSAPVDNTISGVIASNSSFTTLNSIIIKAGLTDTLSSTGPFTLIAPSDTAFTGSGISSSDLASLTPDQLKTILLYHTIPSKILAADMPAGPNAKVITESGDSVFITKNGNGVFINGFPVTQADIPASNGIIHAFARVLMPPAGNLVETAGADTSLTFVVAAVQRASQGTSNVGGILSGSNLYTVFAPTNEAFRTAGFATIDEINTADPDTLTNILMYHVIPGRIFSTDMIDGEQPVTLNGGALTVSIAGTVFVKGTGNTNPSAVTKANIIARNGVVHKIDQVLLP